MSGKGQKLYLNLMLIVLAVFLTGNAHALNVTFFESPSSNGYSTWDDPDNLATHDAWLAAIGETPDYKEDWEGYDWEGKGWYSGRVFDVIEEPGAVFGGGATFSNVGSNRGYVATALRGVYGQLGAAAAIGYLSWRGYGNPGYEDNMSTMYFGPDGSDYVGFWIFDIDHGDPVTYWLHFTDGTVEGIKGKGTVNRHYRFVGFLNQHPGARFAKLAIEAPTHSAFGIDELEWGSTANPVPEPTSLLLLSSCLLGTIGFKKWQGRG